MCTLWLQTKINTSGFKQQRVLTLDKDSKCVWNFNTKMQLRKQIPLSQLVQVCTGYLSPPPPSPPPSPPRLLQSHLVFLGSGL